MQHCEKPGHFYNSGSTGLFSFAILCIYSCFLGLAKTLLKSPFLADRSDAIIFLYPLSLLILFWGQGAQFLANSKAEMNTHVLLNYIFITVPLVGYLELKIHIAFLSFTNGLGI